MSDMSRTKHKHVIFLKGLACGLMLSFQISQHYCCLSLCTQEGKSIEGLFCQLYNILSYIRSAFLILVARCLFAPLPLSKAI